MIRIYLSRILGERRWSQAKLAKITGIRPTTIGLLYNEQSRRIELDYLDKICNALGCDLSDLLEYTPDKRLTLQDYADRQKAGKSEKAD